MRLTTSPPSCAECHEIWDLNLLEPSGPHRACYRTVLHLPLYMYIIRVSSYLTGNTLRSHYKDKSLNAVVKIDVYIASHKEDIDTMFGGKMHSLLMSDHTSGGTWTYHCASTGYGGQLWIYHVYINTVVLISP